MAQDKLEGAIEYALKRHRPGEALTPGMPLPVDIPYGNRMIDVPGSPGYDPEVHKEAKWNSDAVAVAVASGTARVEKTAMAVPAYNPQKDPATANYFKKREGGFTTDDGVRHKFDVVPKILKHTGQDGGGSSSLGWAYDKRFQILPGQRYMQERSQRFKGRSKMDNSGHTGIDERYRIRTSTRKDILEQTPIEAKRTHFIRTVERRGELDYLPASIEYGRHGLNRPKSVPIPLPNSRPKSRQEFREDAKWRYGSKYKPPAPWKKPPPPPGPKKSLTQIINERTTHDVDTKKLLKPEKPEYSFVVPESGPFLLANKKKTKKQLREEVEPWLRLC